MGLSVSYADGLCLCLCLGFIFWDLFFTLSLPLKETEKGSTAVFVPTRRLARSSFAQCWRGQVHCKGAALLSFICCKAGGSEEVSQFQNIEQPCLLPQQVHPSLLSQLIRQLFCLQVRFAKSYQYVLAGAGPESNRYVGALAALRPPRVSHSSECRYGSHTCTELRRWSLKPFSFSTPPFVHV